MRPPPLKRSLLRSLPSVTVTHRPHRTAAFLAIPTITPSLDPDAFPTPEDAILGGERGAPTRSAGFFPHDLRNWLFSRTVAPPPSPRRRGEGRLDGRVPWDTPLLSPAEGRTCFKIFNPSYSIFLSRMFRPASRPLPTFKACFNAPPKNIRFLRPGEGVSSAALPPPLAQALRGVHMSQKERDRGGGWLNDSV